MSFCTGFLQPDGHIEMRPNRIATHYMKTWLGLDVSLVTLDWIDMLVQVAGSTGGADILRMGKVSRIFRILRMLRLARLAKMKEIIKYITFRMRSERLVIMADIA